MGGYGSGREGWRATVESSYPLNANKIGHGFQGVGTIRWTCRGEPSGSASYQRIDGGQWRIWCRVNDHPVDQVLELETTRPHYGGLRYWWRCPRCHGRRAKLYLKARGVACRVCYGLTYQSCKDSRKLTWLYRLMDGKWQGTPPTPQELRRWYR